MTIQAEDVFVMAHTNGVGVQNGPKPVAILSGVIRLGPEVSQEGRAPVFHRGNRPEHNAKALVLP